MREMSTEVCDLVQTDFLELSREDIFADDEVSRWAIRRPYQITFPTMR